METFLRLFPFALLLRGVFPGIFFVGAYDILHSAKRWQALEDLPQAPQALMWIAIAAFIGVAVYGIHRSILYPPIEHFMINSAPPRCRLIGKKTAEILVRRWSLNGDRSDGIDQLAEHLSGWGNVAHLQYTSAWCIIAAFLVTVRVDCWLILLAIVFFLAGFVSDLRLQRVWQEAEYFAMKHNDPLRAHSLSH